MILTTNKSSKNKHAVKNKKMNALSIQYIFIGLITVYENKNKTQKPTNGMTAFSMVTRLKQTNAK